MCLCQLTNMILDDAKIEIHPGMNLISLQKAFDTLDLKIVLDKMKCIDFSGKKLKSFHSYLTHVDYFISLDVFSEAGTINYEVP